MNDNQNQYLTPKKKQQKSAFWNDPYIDIYLYNYNNDMYQLICYDLIAIFPVDTKFVLLCAHTVLSASFEIYLD